jgi:hypothetical protein
MLTWMMWLQTSSAATSELTAAAAAAQVPLHQQHVREPC